ncbi:hypothetical protein [Desulfovibrio litoralis]|uniref:YARHG domain-containing protein n=1 Tax=Desulfovibrio litoralis DSM 11393 TaxID=1121455 RepID=A0A1M7TJZ0_9BACT|nr:hypothetical protein [Desulfovibrio litoralis]SHN70953.1 hypothetical protein SAMN02745728_02114 [Desulfovibrio litoralis DSM 11393]
MKRICFLYCMIFVFLLMPNIVGATQSRDDGLSQFMFGISYNELLDTGDIRSHKAEFLAGEEIQGVFEEYDTLLYDKKNGYMELHLDASPCDCPGKITAAAYAKRNGGYLFLRNKETTCIYRHVNGIVASEPITSYMPVGFGLQMFLPEHFSLPKNDEAAFFLTAEIPRQGTTTTLQLKQIPFGLYVPSTTLLIDDAPLALADKAKEVEQINDPQLSLENGSFYKTYHNIHESALIFFDPEQFNDEAYPTELPKKELQDMLLSGNLSAIGEKDRHILEKLGAYASSYPPITLEHMSERFRFFYMVYQVEQNLVWDTCTMEWDSVAGRFRITKKWLSRKKPASFLEFLRDADFWVAAC